MKNFLLTYLKDGITHYDWFKSKEEMQYFINNNELSYVIDAIEIIESKKVNTVFDNKTLNK